MNAGTEEEGSSSDQPGQQQAAAMQPALLQGSSSTDVKVGSGLAGWLTLLQVWCIACCCTHKDKQQLA